MIGRKSYAGNKKLSEKEQIHLLHSCFHGFNRLAHLVLHRMDRDTHSDGYFLVFQPLFLGQQKHFPALFRQRVYGRPYTGLIVSPFFTFFSERISSRSEGCKLLSINESFFKMSMHRFLTMAYRYDLRPLVSTPLFFRLHSSMKQSCTVSSASSISFR